MATEGRTGESRGEHEYQDVALSDFTSSTCERLNIKGSCEIEIVSGVFVDGDLVPQNSFRGRVTNFTSAILGV